MDASKFFPELYFKGDDFTGREVDLTTRAVVVETLHGDRGDEDKIVVYFDETLAKATADGRPTSEKRMVLSKTLYVDFVTMFNSKETEAWKGKKITLYRGKSVKGGKMVIRARIAVPRSTPATTTPAKPETAT